MTCQPACISADTLHPVLIAMRQPLRLRAMSPFARPFDETALTVTRFSPPLPIRPLTSAALGWKASWGDIPVLNPSQTPRALHACIFSCLVACTRLCELAPAAGLFALHPPMQRLPVLFRGKFTPHFGY